MNWHVGDTALHLGEKVMVKADRGGGRLSVEDDEGFAYAVAATDLTPLRQAAAPKPDPAIPTCYLCKRDVSDGDYVNVDYGLHVEHICSVCWEKRDEDYLTERLDNTDD